MGRCVHTGIIHSIQLCKSHVYVLTSSRWSTHDGRREVRADSTCAQTTFLPARCATAVVWSLGEDRISPLAAARAVLLTPDAGRTTSLLCARAHPYAPSSSRMLVRAHAQPPLPPPDCLPHKVSHTVSRSARRSLRPAPRNVVDPAALVSRMPPPPPSPLPLSPLPLPSRVSTILQAGQGAPGGKVPKGAGGPRGQGGPGGPQGARGDRGQGARGQPSDGSRRHLRALT